MSSGLTTVGSILFICLFHSILPVMCCFVRCVVFVRKTVSRSCTNCLFAAFSLCQCHPKQSAISLSFTEINSFFHFYYLICCFNKRKNECQFLIVILDLCDA